MRTLSPPLFVGGPYIDGNEAGQGSAHHGHLAVCAWQQAAEHRLHHLEEGQGRRMRECM